QAEDGIRDKLVTRVQTCALPIWAWRPTGTPWTGSPVDPAVPHGRSLRMSGTVLAERYDALFLDLDGVLYRGDRAVPAAPRVVREIGRASCRERVGVAAGGGACAG